MSRTVKPVATLRPHVAVVALVMFTASGCALFGNASSFSSMIADGAPRTPDDKDYSLVPQSEFDDSVSNIANNQTPDNSGRSAPAVRLLAPDFEDGTDTGGHAPTGVPTSQWVSDDAVTDASLAESFSETEPAQTDNPFFRQDSQITTVAGTVNAAADATGRSTAAGAAATPKSNQERSVLDRIRGFTDPGPERKNSRGYLRRQFDKLPKSFSNPFDFLNGDDDEPPQSTARPLEEIPDAPQSGIPDSNPFTESASETLPPPDADIPALLIEALERELRSWPRSNDGTPLQPELYRQREVDLRLARLIADRPAAAAEAIESLSPHEQEFWQELILGISQFRRLDDSVAYNDQLSMTVGQLRSAIRQLEPISSLSIRRLDFCERIHGFGSIESRNSTIFDSGNRMMIYAEVENLATELTDFGSYRTVFSGTLELWAANGSEALMTYPIEPNDSESTSRRVDYFLSANVTLPSHLPPGEYEMNLRLQDDLNNRQAAGILKFSVQ